MNSNTSITKVGDDTIVYFHYRSLKIMFLVLICVLGIGYLFLNYYSLHQPNSWVFALGWIVIVFIFHPMGVKVTAQKDGTLVIDKKATVFYTRTITIKSDQRPYLSSQMSLFDMPKFLAYRVNFSKSSSFLKRIYHPYIFYREKNKIDLIPLLLTLSRNIGERQLPNEDEMKKIAESLNIPMNVSKA